MRWKDRKYGTYREISKFLWFPKNINHETRWLENVTWFQTWQYGQYGDFWLDERWIDNAKLPNPPF